MAPFRVALIGTGRVGYQFSFGALPDNHAAAVAANVRCRLVAGVNRGRHYFDLLDLFAGAPAWLCGMAEQRSRPWAVEDFSAAFIKFRSGVTGIVHGAELTDYEYCSFMLSGSSGVIRMQDERVRLQQSQPAGSEPDSGFQWRQLTESPVEPPADTSSYSVALDELLNALEGKAELCSDGRVGRRSLEMIMAVYQSQLQGNRPVFFPVTLTDSGVQALRAAGQFRRAP